jgi:hypothetical protein
MGRAYSRRLKDKKREAEYKKRLEQTKAAKKIIINNQFNDHEKKESIALINAEQANIKLKNRFGDELEIEVVPCVQKGLVLEDMYGHGAIQNGVLWKRKPRKS